MAVSRQRWIHEHVCILLQIAIDSEYFILHGCTFDEFVVLPEILQFDLKVTTYHCESYMCPRKRRRLSNKCNVTQRLETLVIFVMIITLQYVYFYVSVYVYEHSRSVI